MSIARNSIYNMAGSVVPLVLAIVTVPLYLNTIGTERYGALAIAWLILGYFGLFDMGLGRAVAQKIASAKDTTAENRSEIYWTASVISLIMGCLGALSIWGVGYLFISSYFKASPAIVNEVLVALPFLALILPFVTVGSVATGALQGREHFIDYNIGIIVGTCLFQLLPLLTAYFYGQELYMLIIAAGIARLLALIFNKYLVWRKMLRSIVPKFNKNSASNLLSFGGWMTLTGIIAPALYMVDRLAISAVLGAAAVAIYAIPYQISSRLSIIPTALNNAIFPRMSSLENEKELHIWTLSTQMTLAIMTPVIMGLIFNMHWLLELWIGAEIANEAYLIGQILLISSWGLAMALIPLTVLHARAQPKKALLAYIIEIPIYVFALWYGLENYGLIGAAAAYALRCVLDVILLSALAGSFPAKYASLMSLTLSILSIFGANYYNVDFNMWIILMILAAIIAILFSYIILPKHIKQKAMAQIGF